MYAMTQIAEIESNFTQMKFTRALLLRTSYTFRHAVFHCLQLCPSLVSFMVELLESDADRLAINVGF